MIVLKEPYCGHILDGTKTLELRCHAIKHDYYLADSTSHTVRAFLKFGNSFKLDQDTYEATRHLHRCVSGSKPYAKTVATQIVKVIPLDHPVPYACKRGAIGYARFHSVMNNGQGAEN